MVTRMDSRKNELCQRGARRSVNHREPLGQSLVAHPIAEAPAHVRQHSIAAVEVLLEVGADPRVMNRSRKTAIQIARKEARRQGLA